MISRRLNPEGRGRLSFLLPLLLATAIGWGQDRLPVIEPTADAAAEWQEEQDRRFMSLSLDAAKAHAATPLRVTADPAKVDELYTSSHRGRLPAGVIIPAGKAISLAESAGKTRSAPVAGGHFNAGDTSWTYTIESPGAYGIRLHLEEVDLPKGVELYVYSLNPAHPEAHGPYTLTGPDGSGSFWTPSLHDSTVYLEIRAAKGASPALLDKTTLLISEVGHLAGPAWESMAAKDEEDPLQKCGVTAACGSSMLPEWTIYRHAVAQLLFNDGTFMYVCTGSLIASESGLPYLLTAGHCIDTEDVARTVEATWDFYAASCGGLTPPGLPRTNGASLLSASSYQTGTDHSLLLLNATPPSGRVYLGYTTTAPSVGTRQHRLHHPRGEQLYYERVTIINQRYNCPDLSPSRYIMGRRDQGVAIGGSSGSALINSSGQILGQLFGVCNPNDDCGTDYDIIDGRFGVTWPSISRHLEQAVERPPNQYFEDALVLGSTEATVEGTNLYATKQPGEPNHAGNAGGASVWYRWRSPQTGGEVLIETCGSDFDTTLAVYRGASLSGLDMIASNDDACGLQSAVSFRPSPGVDYMIAVDGYDGAQGSIRLAVSFDADLLYYRLTASVTPAGGGTVTFDPTPTGPGYYQEGTSVTLTATSAEGYQFVGWSGAATGSNPVTSVVMDQNQDVFAVFTPMVPEGFQVY